MVSTVSMVAHTNRYPKTHHTLIHTHCRSKTCHLAAKLWHLEVSMQTNLHHGHWFIREPCPDDIIGHHTPIYYLAAGLWHIQVSKVVTWRPLECRTCQVLTAACSRFMISNSSHIKVLGTLKVCYTPGKENCAAKRINTYKWPKRL